MRALKQINSFKDGALNLLVIFLLVSCSSLQKPVPSSPTRGDKAAIDDLKTDDEVPSSNASPPVESNSEANKKAPPKAEPHKVSANSFATLAKANRLEQMREEAMKVLASNANDVSSLNALAFVYFKKAKIGAARIVLERANEKNPNTPQVLTNLAVLDLADNEPARALTNLKRSYKIDDHNPETLGLIGSIYLQNHDFAKALLPLEQSYRNDKSNLKIANNYAVALTKTKSYEQAQKIYDEILAQNSRESEILLNYAGLLVDYLNKPKEGLNIIYKVKFIETERKDILDLANKLENRAKTALKSIKE